ncbi:hypothetical protein BCR44DRAFT_1439021 [Catenaria anguillulae PL171]|uniref:SSD domain-containing protein n=1 Tax=Catenaria anguillulae PL171 TaxID=765915 RepID=A0A1Y2HEP7_9FUNG|nr:hypothetical protein BCR44DRAFT_1439021 [Catenaria anguillulae PL171]
MPQHPVMSATQSGGGLSLFAAPAANKRGGRCVMYGQCGRKSFFSPPLNCPVDLMPAVEPSPDFRARLTAKCGARYASGAVCCDPAQLATLESSITIAERFVSACPACWQNMQAFWCDFICHPDQASFLNVTAVETVSGKDVVMGVDYVVGESFSRGFYDSCKDIKFGPDNRFAMDFIGGGAKSPQQFLDFMGAPKPEVGGSPFPIRFPTGAAVPSTFTPHSPPAIPCNSTIPGTACSCVDCEQVCPVLPPLHNPTDDAADGAHRPHLPDVPPIPGCTLGTWSCRAIAGAVLVLVIVLGWVVVGLTRWGRRVVRRAARKRALLQAASIAANRQQDEEERQGLLSPSSTRAVAGDVSEDDDEGEEADEDNRHSYSLTVEGGRVHIHVLRTNPPTGAEALFLRLGEFATNRPSTTIFLSLLVVLGCLSGWYFRGLGIVTDPIGLWVPPNSPALAAKAMFDSHFGPFYRTQQLIITSANTSSPNVVTESALRQVFALQTQLTLEGTFDGTSLADVCLHPLPNVPVPGGCVVQSVAGYWQNSLAVFNKSDWRTHLATCVANPAQTQCLPAFGQPIKPEMVMDLDTPPTAKRAAKASTSPPTASAFVVTFVNRNADSSTPAGRALLANALKWEAWARGVLERESQSWSKPSSSATPLSLAYSTESSIETEVARATSADGWIVAVSYVAMVAYIISTLRSPTVGFTAVVLVLLSVGMAMGIMAWAQVPASFILLEVLPFLALAIGVDNVFLLVEALHAVTLFPNTKARVATALSRQGPGFLLSFTCEVLVFLAAALIDIPAVSAFALYAATTVACLFFLQCTMFVAVLSLIHVPPVVHSATWWSRFVKWLIRNRWGLLATVAGVTTGTALLLGNVQLGLDQRDALPKESHLAGYFDALDRHFAVGPPVYYMVPDVDMDTMDDFVNMCGRFADCRNVSVPNVLEQERKRSWDSYLASPSTAWLDDFVYWLQPNPDDDADDDFGPPSCCARRRANMTEFCDPNSDSAGDCVSCISPARKWSPTSIRSTLNAVHGQVPDLLRHWLASTPSADCPQAGAAYADTAAHELVAKELTVLTGRQVTAYSVFHPFFAQYDGLEVATWKLLILAHLLVGCVAVVLLASIRHALLLVISMVIMLVWIAGVSLGIAGVPLNGVSVVNLVMATGLGVEFCVHVLRALAGPPARTRAQRVKQALVGAGAAVLAGIGWTKLVGVAVLAFARSSIFRTYYFGLYLCILVAGLMVGLIVLPLLLLFFGAEAKDEDTVVPNGPAIVPAASSPDPSRLGRLPTRPLHGNVNGLLPITGSSPATASTVTPTSPTPTNPRPPAHVVNLSSSTSPSGVASDSLASPAHHHFATPVPLPSHLSMSASEQSSSTGGSTTIQASAVAPSTSRPRAIPQYIVAEQQQQQQIGGRGKATFEVGSMGQGGAGSSLESD